MDGRCFPWTDRAGQTEKARPELVLFCGRQHTISTFDPVRLVDPEAANGVALASAGGWQQPLRPSPIQRPVSGVASPVRRQCEGIVTSLYFPARRGGNSQWNWPSLFLTDTGSPPRNFQWDGSVVWCLDAALLCCVVLCCAVLCRSDVHPTSFSSGQCR